MIKFIIYKPVTKSHTHNIPSWLPDAAMWGFTWSINKHVIGP